MNATVETLDFEADALAVANANVPAIVGRPFEYSDIGAQAVPWAIYKDPAAAIAAASTTGTKVECAPKILQTPQVTEAKMFDPGHVGQTTIIKVHFNAVEGCDNWQRIGKFRPQLKRNGRWINWEGSVWLPLGVGGPRSNEKHPAGFIDVATNHVFDENCEPARIQLRNFMRNADTGKIAAKGAIKYHPIDVEGC